MSNLTFRERMAERAKTDPDVAALMALLADTEESLERACRERDARPNPNARQEVWGYDG